MSAYVLVHGAGMGGDCWDRLSPLLDGDVVAVDLPGRGSRSDVDVATVSLADCAAALEDEIVSRDLRDVVLVAHSFAGVTVPRVMESLAGRLRHVVFLSAVVPEDGTAVIDQIDPAVRDAVMESIEDGVYHQTPEGVRFMLCNDMTPEQTEWTLGLVSDESAALLMEPVDLSGLGAGVPRTYVRLSEDACYPPELQERSAHRVGGNVAHIASGHMAMVTRADEVAALLGQLGR
ncbi:alpha/beta fold hydrolase [Aeromicrobium endophyticum]|uniref:Alpha/beta hydrolase n=1 Tax=Aeromicrobium endophyticum TaxID=2292704 RepID=A0A371P9S0_9ACTN|nr:alpha/beta hydrolase [Aeromicrobium endophyticum]REK72679.1 alpha/beta hydrolase [Aeromicrobium endophyticum]